MAPGAAFTTIPRPREGLLILEVPAAAVRKLGDRQRPPVRVSLNGVEYRSTIAVYGGRYTCRPARRSATQRSSRRGSAHG